MRPPVQIYKKVMSAPVYVRLPLGALLIGGGVLGFLPILGFWMIPLGVIVCLAGIPQVRRWVNRQRRAIQTKLRR